MMEFAKRTLAMVVKLSMQCCEQILWDSFETFKNLF